MNASVAAQARHLPRTPGIYRFYAADGTLLYVGKASSLRTRVASYLRQTARQSPRTQQLVSVLARLEFTVTPSEGDALILEQEQIKTLKPRYNVLFRDDKSYPYLRLSAHRIPRLALHRGTPGRDCHGPFPSSWAVRESIRVLQRVFRLRTCTDSTFANRVRPCLLHQIGQCSAPCTEHPDARDYAADVTAARQFLAGNDSQVSHHLTTRMEAAAVRQDYEQAAHFRDSIDALATIRHASAVTGGAREADFIGIYRGAGGVAVRLAAVRGGCLAGEFDYFPTNAVGADTDEVLAAFLPHHYGRHRRPARIVVRSATKVATLSLLLGSPPATVITRPRGNERERLAMVTANAEQALLSRVDNATLAGAAAAELAVAVATPRLDWVDCFDISHSMGEATMAACVVCRAGIMVPSEYRRFHLRRTVAGDDYAGMREVLGRRYRHAATDPQGLPDMVVVDGGAGQVGVAVTTLAGLGLAGVPVLGIAKGPTRKPGLEELLTGDGEVLALPSSAPAFRLVQRMRDEAHRFALAAHRRRRDRQRRRSVLEDIEGIGPQIRRRLVNEFGGLQGVKRASSRDLSRINGVGSELARRIYTALHA